MSTKETYQKIYDALRFRRHAEKYAMSYGAAYYRTRLSAAYEHLDYLASEYPVIYSAAVKSYLESLA